MEYDWKRRWFSAYEGGSGSSGATARAREAQALWQLRFTTDAVLFDKIQHIPCLILLGEPGMGKTYFAQREEQRLSTDLKNTADESLLQDIAGSGSVDEVQRCLFGTDKYRDWKAGVHRLTLFVDSVDQAGISVEHVITAIVNELVTADTRRLHLRLVCRDYDWSLTLADELDHVWRGHYDSEAKVRVYQLAPLDLDDIRLALAANSANIKYQEHFLTQIEDENALALATVPITLEMLLQEPGHLTNSRTELYDHSLRHLWKHADRRADLKSSELDQRFKIASRIAAIMMLSHKHSVDVAADNVHDSASALAVKDLLLDATNEGEEHLIRAILNAPLFQGTGNRTWRHQSYAEFMAARYLSDENTPIKEILDRSLAPDGKFASHLHDTLRWLIEMRSDVLPEVIQRQPMLVLRADLSHLSEDEVRTIYEGVLSLEDPDFYSYEAWNLGKFQASHPCAKDILLPHLIDKRRSPSLRLFVLRLMEHLDIREIDDALLRLALDKNEEQVIRSVAAGRICDAGSGESKLQLKPYVYGRNDDPEDELKGYALQALWPDHLTAEELFSAISPPKQENFWGSYKTFLFDGGIVDELQVADLPVALRWVAAQPPRYDMAFALNDFPEKIMRKAWGNIGEPGVKEAFAETAVAMISRIDGLFSQHPHMYPPNKELDEFEQGFIATSGHRCDLVLLSLPHLLHKERAAYSLIHCWPPLVVTDDLDWLLEHMDPEMTTNVEIRTQIAQLVESLLPGLRFQNKALSERNRDIEKVYYAAERYPELTQLTQRHFEAVALFDSDNPEEPATIPEREHLRQMKEIDEQIAQQRAEVRPFERLREALDLMDAGETFQWINVIYALSHWPDGRGDSWNWKPDLTDFPLWRSCDNETQERIVEAAQAYVIGQDTISTADSSEDWYDTGRIPYVELYGYLAIFLLCKADTNALHQLPARKWERWSKVAVWYPDNILLDVGRTDYRREIRELQQDLLRRLHENAPRAFTNTLRTLLLSEDRRNSYIGQTLRKVEHLRDSGLEPILLSLLQDATLSPKGQRSMLDFLLAQPNDEAQRIAEARILSGSTNQNEKALLAECAVSLLTNVREFDRSMIWELFHNDDAVGRLIVEKIAEEDRHTARIATKLSAPELVDLFIWVERRYPTGDDPQFDGVHTITTREQIGHWRNGLIQELRKKDSWEALHGIRLILRHFPNLESLRYVRLDLEKTVEGSGWNPPSPKDIISWLVAISTHA